MFDELTPRLRERPSELTTALRQCAVAIPQIGIEGPIAIAEIGIELPPLFGQLRAADRLVHPGQFHLERTRRSSSPVSTAIDSKFCNVT